MRSASQQIRKNDVPSVTLQELIETEGLQERYTVPEGLLFFDVFIHIDDASGLSGASAASRDAQCCVTAGRQRGP